MRVVVSTSALALALFGGADALSIAASARPTAAHAHAAGTMPAVASRAGVPKLEVADPECGVVSVTDGCVGPLGRKAPFSKVMAANRAEIAVRIARACTELNMQTVAVYGYEDRYSMHRWGADQSFMLDKAPEASPISAYLDIDQIISIAKVRHARDAGRAHLTLPAPAAHARIARTLAGEWRRRHPPRLRLPLGVARVCRRVRGQQHHLCRPEGRESQYVC